MTNQTQLQQPEYSRVQPQARDLEEAVLGACMIDKKAFGVVSRILTSKECFYVDAHGYIYEAMDKLNIQGQPIDLLTVADELNKAKKLNKAGGAAFLSGLTNRVASAANVEYHSRIILQKHISRKIIHICARTITRAYEETTDPLKMLDGINEVVFSLQNEIAVRAIHNLVDIIPAMKKRFIDLRLRSEGMVGVSSGLKSIDRVTGGWQNTDLIIICARPGMGKTAFAMSMVRHMIVESKKKVAFFSLEMSDTQLVDRLISGITGISSRRIRDPKSLSEGEADLYLNTADSLVKYNLFIDDTPGIRITELKGKARELMEEEGIDIIFVDYLQLMRGTRGTKNREQVIGEISRGLKGLAKELDIPVIALAQLSRETERRGGNRKPQLADLRESGSIEQDADFVGGLYRPEYYGIDKDANGQPLNGYSELIIMKHRNGPTTTVLMKYVPTLTTFLDVDDRPALQDEVYTPYTEVDNDKDGDNAFDDPLPF